MAEQKHDSLTLSGDAPLCGKADCTAPRRRSSAKNSSNPHVEHMANMATTMEHFQH